MGVRNRLVLDQIAAICRPSSVRLSIPLVREVRQVHRSSPPVARINFINRKERVHHRKVNRKLCSPSRVNLKQVNNTRASKTRVSNARVSPTKAMGRRRSRDKEGDSPSRESQGGNPGQGMGEGPQSPRQSSPSSSPSWIQCPRGPDSSPSYQTHPGLFGGAETGSSPGRQSSTGPMRPLVIETSNPSGIGGTGDWEPRHPTRRPARWSCAGRMNRVSRKARSAISATLHLYRRHIVPGCRRTGRGDYVQHESRTGGRVARGTSAVAYGDLGSCSRGRNLGAGHTVRDSPRWQRPFTTNGRHRQRMANQLVGQLHIRMTFEHVS